MWGGNSILNKTFGISRKEHAGLVQGDAVNAICVNTVVIAWPWLHFLVDNEVFQ